MMRVRGTVRGRQNMNDEARQHISATFIVILLLVCVFSTFINFPIEKYDV